MAAIAVEPVLTEQRPQDARTWTPTDLPGEEISMGRVMPGLEVLSVRGTTRHWSEQLHVTFTVAAIRKAPSKVAAEWRTRGESLTAARGQLMTINAGDGHRTSHVPGPADFDVVKFEPSLIEDEAASARGAHRAFRFRSAVSENESVFEGVRRLTRALADSESAFVIEATCHELAYSVATELAEAEPRAPARDPVRDFRLRRIRERLREQLDDRPTFEALEQDSGLRKAQLCALFKKEYGVSIGRYWTDCRLAKATAALVCGAPAKQVAADFGFTDQAHFTRLFRRQHGLPPAAWSSLYRRNSRVELPRRS